MIQLQQSKKIKGARKKARKEVFERLYLRYPTWFDGKTEKEIKDLITAFRQSKKDDDDFPSFCVSYEAEQERIKTMCRENAYRTIEEYDKILNKAFPDIPNNMRDATLEEMQNIKNHINEIAEATHFNFNN